jgi:hypothetical protein
MTDVSGYQDGDGISACIATFYLLPELIVPVGLLTVEEAEETDRGCAGLG